MSPYENLPRRNFWKTGVAEMPATEIDELYIKKFDIPADAQLHLQIPPAGFRQDERECQ